MEMTLNNSFNEELENYLNEQKSLVKKLKADATKIEASIGRNIGLINESEIRDWKSLLKFYKKEETLLRKHVDRKNQRMKQTETHLEILQNARADRQQLLEAIHLTEEEVNELSANVLQLEGNILEKKALKAGGNEKDESQGHESNIKDILRRCKSNMNESKKKLKNFKNSLSIIRKDLEKEERFMQNPGSSPSRRKLSVLSDVIFDDEMSISDETLVKNIENEVRNKKEILLKIETDLRNVEQRIEIEKENSEKSKNNGDFEKTKTHNDILVELRLAEQQLEDRLFNLQENIGYLDEALFDEIMSMGLKRFISILKGLWNN